MKKVILYSLMLIIGLTAFILEIFVFQKPDGFLGLLICIVSLILIFGSCVNYVIFYSKYQEEQLYETKQAR